jgi:hypothetical protein
MPFAKPFVAFAAMFVILLFVPLRAYASLCGSNVKWSGSSATVLPSDGDDTAALQCVFTALSGMPGAEVRLVAGAYTTGNLFITDFDGSFSGAGSGATSIGNGVMQQIAPDFFLTDPSLSNPWPLLITFKGGHFTVRDIGFEIRGASPTTWTIPGFPELHSLAVIAAVFGQVDAQFVRVRMIGERAPDDPVFGYNTYNGIVFQGPAVTPASGTLIIDDSSFRTVGSWAPIYGVQQGRLTATGNEVEDVFFAFDIFTLTNTRVLYAGNVIRDALVTSIIGTLDASSIGLVANEVESSASGIAMTMVFTNGATCSIVGNKLSGPDPDILLGPGTTHCLVAGNHGATVVDQGTSNIVVGR